MTSKKSFDETKHEKALACIHLRSKAMYVTGDPKNPYDPDGDGDGSQYCWCNLTQHVIGPDGAQVEKSKCISGRDCCEASE